MTESELNRNDTGADLDEKTAIDDAAFEAAKSDASKPCRRTQPPGQPAQPATPQPTETATENKMPPAVVAAVKALRQTHGNVDRFVRDLNANIVMGKTNDNAQGCNLEKDIEAMIEELGKKDRIMLAFEKRCISTNGQGIAAPEVTTVVDEAKAIDDVFKLGRKKLGTLKALWKLG